MRQAAQTGQGTEDLPLPIHHPHLAVRPPNIDPNGNGHLSLLPGLALLRRNESYEATICKNCFTSSNTGLSQGQQPARAASPKRRDGFRLEARNA